MDGTSAIFHILGHICTQEGQGFTPSAAKALKDFFSRNGIKNSYKIFSLVDKYILYTTCSSV